MVNIHYINKLFLCLRETANIKIKFKIMISQCLELLKREEFKKEFKIILHPIIDVFIDELRPYLLYGLWIILFHFIIIICLCYYIIRLKNLSYDII